jgi:dGTPase
MNIRESMEQREQKMLSPYAALSLCSRGRERQEEECLSERQGQDPS